MSKWCDTCYRNELSEEWKSCDSSCTMFGKSPKEIANIVIEQTKYKLTFDTRIQLRFMRKNMNLAAENVSVKLGKSKAWLGQIERGKLFSIKKEDLIKLLSIYTKHSENEIINNGILEDFLTPSKIVQTNHKNAVLQGLENMREYDGYGMGLQYSVNGVDYTVDQMIEEIKNGTEVGREFSQNIYDLTLTYMGKFSQDAD